MNAVDFELNDYQLNHLLHTYPNKGKNGDIGKFSVEVVKLYFLSLNPNITFKTGGRNQPDIIVTDGNNSTEYEVKGTEDSDIAFNKLKVSSKYSYNKLITGMEVIRVTKIRNKKVKLFFLKHGKDFTMKEEPRWSITEIKQAKSLPKE
jgi:Holliday junction resolvase